MNKRIISIVGIAGAALCVIAVALAAVLERTSPLGHYSAELGIYTSGYLVASTALIHNLGIALFGLCFAAIMVIKGLNEATLFNTIQGVIAALMGVGCVGQAFITLNFAPYHYIFSGLFYIAAFALCALYIVFALMSNERRIAYLIVAALTGLVCAVYAVFTLAGGMSVALTASVSQSGNQAFEPFAVIGWAALALIISFVVLLAVDMLRDSEPAFQDRSYSRDIEF